MTSYISHTSIDCAHAYALSEWWKEVLGYVDQPDDPNEPDHEECWIQRPDGGHPLLFIESSAATRTTPPVEELAQRCAAVGPTS